MNDSSMPDIIFVTGVSGCGKSTVAAALAEEYGYPYLEGDEYHPPENVAAMAAGHPLTDEMRWPWLRRLAQEARRQADEAGGAVVSCSGLKRAYRDLLRDVAGGGRMLLLYGDRELLFERMAARKDHYMPPALLDSQLATLELPDDDEPNVKKILVDKPASAVIAEAKKTLKTLLRTPKQISK